MQFPVENQLPHEYRSLRIHHFKSIRGLRTTGMMRWMLSVFPFAMGKLDGKFITIAQQIGSGIDVQIAGPGAVHHAGRSIRKGSVGAQSMVAPPSMTRCSPVMKDASSDARNSTP